MILWNPRTAQWLLDASEYSGFHHKLAALLRPWLGRTLCDVGCGNGAIDLELHDSLDAVTCVDISEAAIAFLNAQLLKRGIPNITAVVGDADTLAGRWDTLLMINFGQWDRRLAQCLSLCGKNLIAVSRVNCESNAGLGHRYPLEGATCHYINERLARQGVVFSYQETVLEYGQPLASMAQAAAFVKEYARELPSGSVEAYLEQRLTVTGREDWPYYLPNEKRMGIFIIPREDNEALVQAAPNRSGVRIS